MLEFLKRIDTKLFLFINNHHCAFCDFIMYWASDRFIWIPFYFFLAIILYKQFGSKFRMIFLSVATLIILNNLLTVFIKNLTMRYRPCHNLLLQTKIHLVNGECGGLYGFVSSHAANSITLVVFIFLLIRKKIKWLCIVLFIWCFMVSYSRIYLAAHYPLDVLGGWITGSVMAGIIFYFYEKILLKEKIKL